MLKLLSSVALIAMMTAPAQAAVTFSTDTVNFTGLGDELGTDFDKITLGGLIGAFNGAGTYDVNDVTFAVGQNRNSAASFTGFFNNAGQIGGSAFSYTLPYALQISDADTITLGGNSLVYGGYNILFNSLTLTSAGAPVTGRLTATVSAVPEAGTWMMMIAGIGIVGVAMRRRQNVRTTVSFV